jgi:hypothetical protein
LTMDPKCGFHIGSRRVEIGLGVQDLS